MSQPPSIRPLSPGRPPALMFARPLVGMECIKSYLGLNEDETREEIALGRLKWAFDLRAGGDRQFLRVLSLSLVAWKCREITQPDELDAVIDLILPQSSRATGVIRATTLQCVFNVVSGHVINLLRAGRLQPASGRRRRGRPGPGGSPLISRTSVVELLRRAHADLQENLAYNTGAVKRQARPASGIAGDSIAISE